MAFPDGWSHRVPITIESDDIDGDLTNWTLVFDQAFDSVLTQVNGPLDADGTRASINGGGDIRFSSDEDGDTQLACDIRTWVTNNTPASATCEAAVLIPSVSSSGDTTIYMWWGASGETQPAVGDTYGQYNAYDGNYLAVIPATETSTDFDDRTSSGYDATWANDLASVSGAVGNGAQCNDGDQTVSADDHAMLGDISALELDTLTVEILVNRQATTPGMGIWGLQAEIIAEYGIIFNTENPGNQFQMAIAISSVYSRHQASTVPTNDTWYHTGVKKSGTVAALLVNGSDTGLGTTATLSSSTVDYSTPSTQNTSFGGYWSHNHSDCVYGMDGYTDEFRISDVARSDAWLNANHHNQLDTSGFLTWGSITDISADLVVADAAHAHSADNLDLTMLTSLTVADAAHAHAADNVVLGYLAIIPAIDDCAHAHAADNVVLGYTAIIPSIDDSLHSHAADEPVITAIYNLDIDEGTHAHAADQCNVVASYILDVADCLHALASDNLDIETSGDLEIQDSAHDHTAENLELVVDLYLQISECLHGHAADNLDVSMLTSLTIANSLHGHAAENLDLVNLYILSVDECLHGHQAENLTMQNVYPIVVADCVHGHSVDNLVLTSLVNLAPADCWHNQAADQCDVETVTDPDDLEIEDARHQHHADTCEPTNVYVLSINDCLHDHIADAVALVYNARNEVYPTIQNTSGDAFVTEMALLNLTLFFGSDVATDVMVDPGALDEADHTADALVQLSNITLPTAAQILFNMRVDVSDEITLVVYANGTASIVENGIARITGSPGDVSAGGRAAVRFEDSTVELWSDGVFINSYAGLTVIDGTGALVSSLGTGGAIGRVDLLPIHFSGLPHDL